LHEDRLSPELGRLIDSAKAAAARLEPTMVGTEVVGVLVPSGEIYLAHAGEAGPRSSAADSALAIARAAGSREVVTAVVAVAHDTSESVSPSPATARALAKLNPDLPVLIKRLGRWVVLPLSRLEALT
jgi:hypothetical protein